MEDLDKILTKYCQDRVSNPSIEGALRVHTAAIQALTEWRDREAAAEVKDLKANVLDELDDNHYYVRVNKVFNDRLAELKKEKE